MSSPIALAYLAMQDLDPKKVKEGLAVVVKRADAFTAYVSIYDRAVYDTTQQCQVIPPNVSHFRVKRTLFPWLYQCSFNGNLVLVPVRRKSVAVLGTVVQTTEVKITPATAKEMDE